MPPIESMSLTSCLVIALADRRQLAEFLSVGNRGEGTRFAADPWLETQSDEGVIVVPDLFDPYDKGDWYRVRRNILAAAALLAAEANRVAPSFVKDQGTIGIEVLPGSRQGQVASGVHPATTFLALVGEQHLPAELAEDIRNFRTRSPSAKVNLTLSELPDFTARPGTEPGPQHPEIMVSPTLTYLERAWDDTKYGRPSARPMIDCVIPTTKDPAIAPEDAHIMNCFVQYVPYQPADGPWDDASRDALANSVIDTITQFAPNFRNAVTHRQVLTPYDLEQRFGLLGGNIFHGEISPDQLFSLRPSPLAAAYRTPLAGLYLCASGTHPGGGVMGIPGLNASRVIIRDSRHRTLGNRAASAR